MIATTKETSLEELNKIADTHKCAICGSSLVVDNPTGEGCELRCLKDSSHQVLHRTDKNYARLNWLKQKKGQVRGMDTMALQKMDEAKMIERVNQARWPKELTLADKKLIATVSLTYGLDPIFNELMIYQGRPYVTIDARRRKAQESGRLDGINSRPATSEERKARNTPEKDFLFYCQVWVKGSAHPFEGWGHVREKETKGSDFLPIVNDPMMMAEKRSESQALRRAFHIPLPSAEDINEDTNVVEGEAHEIAEVSGAITEPKEETEQPAAGDTEAEVAPVEPKQKASPKSGVEDERIITREEHKELIELIGLKGIGAQALGDIIANKIKITLPKSGKLSDLKKNQCDELVKYLKNLK